MMEEDQEAIKFSEDVFTRLWHSQNITTKYISSITPQNSEFIEEVCRRILVLSSITSSTINKQLESYFNNNVLTRRNIFTFIATYCFEYHAKNDDIFQVILNTCNFVYRTMLFCYGRGKHNFVDFGSHCWTDIFNYDLKEEFYAKGGWEELKRFAKANSKNSNDASDIHGKYLDLLNDINSFILKCTITDEQESISSPEAASLNTSEEQSAEDSYSESFEQPDFSTTAHYVSPSMCEANITVEEAVSAYKILTSFYGENCVKLNGKNTAVLDSLPSDIVDIEHIYKTLTNFINQGISEVEASAKVRPIPDVVGDVDIHKALLYCRSCQQEDPSVIDNDTIQAILYLSSLVSKIIPDDVKIIPDDAKIGSVEHNDQLNAR